MRAQKISQEILKETLFSNGDYGHEFDRAAIDRMIFGGKQILPYLIKYKSELKGLCVEFGPYENPMMDPEYFKESEIAFVDGDKNALAFLKNHFNWSSSVHLYHKDLNSESVSIASTLKMIMSDINRAPKAMIASQLVNYIDYRNFFQAINEVSLPNTSLFINNVTDYGIPELFSPMRPHSDEEMIETLKNLGWETVESVRLPIAFREQPHPRFIGIFKKKS